MAAEQEVLEDYLEVDRPVPGQNFACISFISPEKILEDKKLFNLYKFHLSINLEAKLTFSQFKEQFEDFNSSNETIQTDFNEICDFKTNVRGVKIRGVYDTQREANIRAQVLQKMDSSFHVYVGQVGYWLPWDPDPNDIVDQEYLNNDLNRLNKEYSKNQVKKDMFYEEQKRDKKMAALKENEERKKKNEEEELLRKKEENVIIHDGENVGINDSNKSLEEALNDVDPWMARKIEEEISADIKEKVLEVTEDLKVTEDIKEEVLEEIN